jgi:hypothetical protein
VDDPRCALQRTRASIPLFSRGVRSSLGGTCRYVRVVCWFKCFDVEPQFVIVATSLYARYSILFFRLHKRMKRMSDVEIDLTNILYNVCTVLKVRMKLRCENRSDLSFSFCSRLHSPTIRTIASCFIPVSETTDHQSRIEAHHYHYYSSQRSIGNRRRRRSKGVNKRYKRYTKCTK